MSEVLPSARMQPAADAPWPVVMLPLLLGLAALYGPAYVELAGTLWQSEQYAHGPLIALVSAGLLWHLRRPLGALPDAWSPAAGSAALAGGLLLAVLGLSQHIHLLTFASQPMVLAAVLLLMRGRAGLRMAWFPLLFLLFIVPLPGIFVDTLTNHLKAWVSFSAEEILYQLGYPVARSGVVITIGQYQLLVADACSGLHSMLSLSALGALFVYLMSRTSRWHNALMLASLLPIAFVANLGRVLLLALITFHHGDASAQALHAGLGLSVFVIALVLLIGLDGVLARLHANPPR